MKRTLLVVLIALAFAGFWFWLDPTAHAQPQATIQWIWSDEKPRSKATAGVGYFRKILTVNRPVDQPLDEAVLEITADESYTVWINDKEVGRGSDWHKVASLDVAKFFVNGANVIAVQAAKTKPGPAGLLVRLSYLPNGFSRDSLVGDATWTVSDKEAPGWRTAKFDDKDWQKARVLGAYGVAGPWRDLEWTAPAGKAVASGPGRFSVPGGFKVEEIVKRPEGDNTFSLVNMTFDDKGRLLVSRENGDILLCTEPDKNGVLQKVSTYATQVKNCQGMCWVDKALLVVGAGPGGTGVFRVIDTDGDDKTDKVELVLRTEGAMQEHGPHAIIHGPDDKLYFITGNHAYAQPGENFAKNSPLTRWPTGNMGPDQGKLDTTEDVLLPRINDPRGHAKDRLAPGGTIWRLDRDGKNVALVAAGFRNAYDMTFNPEGELFTFDSDMEWDVGLPWYRPVRVCHVPMGADFVWRTGSANTPSYYIDSLPPIAETGRGSPVGVECYDHIAFPEKYRGSLFMADWAVGILYAVHLKRDGASYKADVEKFLQGTPANLTDLAVGPDGSMYFTMGGRNTQGGVFRIRYEHAEMTDDTKKRSAEGKLQKNSAWSRANKQSSKNQPIKGVGIARTPPGIPNDTMLQQMRDSAKEQRRDMAIFGLEVPDSFVQRRSCEELIEIGIEPPLDKLWPLLGEQDRFVQFSARLVLEHIDPAKWADKIASDQNDLRVYNAIVALCHLNKAEPNADKIFNRLGMTLLAKALTPLQRSDQEALDFLRTLQLALIHTKSRPDIVKSIAEQLQVSFPRLNSRVNREMAILLADFQMEGVLKQPIQSALIAALADAQGDREQQIHYFYCMRHLNEGWTAQNKELLTAWYNSTSTWRGGASFTPYLQTIFKDTLKSFNLSVAERKAIFSQEETNPAGLLALVESLHSDRTAEFMPELAALAGRLEAKKDDNADLGRAVRDALAAGALAKAGPDNFPYLIQGLRSKNPLLRGEAIAELNKQTKLKPKADDSKAFRILLEATTAITNEKEKWQTMQLLRQWTGRSFGAEEGQWEPEYKLWTAWFNQSFPKETPFTMPNPGAASKYKLTDLTASIAKAPGNAAQGKAIFEKAQCVKCHKFGAIGEGVGPDLTDVSKRFKTADILEAILDPSKVISDQYRSLTVTTKNGRSVTGLVTTLGDTVTVTLNDLTKVNLKADDIGSQVASLVSVMPDRLLDPLNEREIADLVAYLESGVR